VCVCVHDTSYVSIIALLKYIRYTTIGHNKMDANTSFADILMDASQACETLMRCLHEIDNASHIFTSKQNIDSQNTAPGEISQESDKNLCYLRETVHALTNKFHEQLYDECSHAFIEDDIELGHDLCRHIVYCGKCGLDKRDATR
jgi:hypothetical protein